MKLFISLFKTIIKNNARPKWAIINNLKMSTEFLHWHSTRRILKLQIVLWKNRGFGPEFLFYQQHSNFFVYVNNIKLSVWLALALKMFDVITTSHQMLIRSYFKNASMYKRSHRFWVSKPVHDFNALSCVTFEVTILKYHCRLCLMGIYFR